MSDLDRKEIARVERATSVVLRALKHAFPDNYDQRCIYAAAGIKYLLEATGMDARIYAGDFLALVVSKDGSHASMQGFGGATGELAFSHYWVETPRLLIDLGPHLLPRGSRFSAAPIPVLAWNKTEPLYLALRYRALERYAPNAQMLLSSDIAERMADFLADTAVRWARQKGPPPTSTWLLTDKRALEKAARRDVWATSVLRFEREADSVSLPL